MRKSASMSFHEQYQLTATVVTIAACFVLGAKISSAAGLQTCTPDKTAAISVFCHASATVRFAGKTLNFENGRCDREHGGSLNVAIGSSAGPPYKPFFALDSFRTSTDFQFSSAGKVEIVDSIGTKLTLTANRTKGTFSGHTTSGKQAVTGSFVCR